MSVPPSGPTSRGLPSRSPTSRGLPSRSPASLDLPGRRPASHVRRALASLAVPAAVAAILLLLPHAIAALPAPDRQPVPVVAADGSLPDVPIVFAARNRVPTLNGIEVGPPLDIIGRELTPGGRLMVWWPDGHVVDLTAGTGLYDVQQPDVSFDGTKVAFSGVRSNGQKWHLYEIGLDGTGFRQLTFDDRSVPIPVDPRSPSRNGRVFGRYGDFGPAYLPDGRIIFASTRFMTTSASCGQRGLNLYVLDPATGEIHRRTTERSGAIDPAVLHDGTIVFSHWVDAMSAPALDGPGLRPLEDDYNFAPSLWAAWTMDPDGRGARRLAFAGGGFVDSGGIYQPRELPDGDLVVTFRGSRGLLGSTLANAITRIAPRPTEVRKLQFLGDPYNQQAPHALGPAPLADGRIVCSYTLTPTLAVDWRGRRTADYDFGLYVVDEALKTLTPLYNEPDTDELDAVAVYPRQAPIIPDSPKSDVITEDPAVDLGTTATMINRGVYADLPVGVANLPSPKVGTVVRLDVYDDGQTFTTSDDFPKLTKQMPRFVASFPVDAHGAFTATVPADRALMFVLINQNGVAVRSLISPDREDRPAASLTHTFNGHDYLRPDAVIECAGCHRGHMYRPGLVATAQPNLARVAVASASSAPQAFYGGVWRVNDLRLASGAGRFAWVSDGGAGQWVQLDWPMAVEVDRAVLHPLTARGCRVRAGTLALSDGSTYDIGPLPADGSPLTVDFDPPRTIQWLRFTVDRAASDLVGLAEIEVNGPADVSLPDTPPPAPANLSITAGVLSLTWDPVTDPGLAGYKLYYGTTPGQYTASADVGDVVSFIMRDLVTDGETYYVAAKAYNVHGTESQAYSNEVSATARGPVVLAIEPDHGPIGGFTPITVTGLNFTTGARLRMGGSHALNVRVVDDQTITALTHWYGEGAVDVEVSNPDDLTSVLAGGFTYLKPERPAVLIYLPMASKR